MHLVVRPEQLTEGGRQCYEMLIYVLDCRSINVENKRNDRHQPGKKTDKRLNVCERLSSKFSLAQKRDRTFWTAKSKSSLAYEKICDISSMFLERIKAAQV